MRSRTRVGISLVIGVLTFSLGVQGVRARVDTPSRPSPESDRAREQGEEATADPALVGRWSLPVHVGVVGIHAALFHTGEVLLWEEPHGGLGSRAKLLDPRNGHLTDVSIPYPRDAFCSGTSILPDGRLLVAGGLRPGTNDAPRATDLFDPITQRWSLTSPMAAPRYYPTLTALPDGTTLVLSGNHTVFGGETEDTVESYRPADGTWGTLPKSADVETAMYPRTLVLPDGRVLRAGPERLSRLFDPATNTWSDVAPMRFGNRFEGAAVLLPGLRRVMTSGGAVREDPAPWVVPTATAEELDLHAPSPSWRPAGSMHRARMYHELVLLADGTVLAVGGAARGLLYSEPVHEAELYDPATRTWRTMASQTAPRPYHSTALLLPDGRVLSAGSDFGPLADTVEIYSPPYLFRGPRPRIAQVPRAIGYGDRFSILTSRPSSISRVALIRPGAVTHSVNFDQRYVDLRFRRSGGRIHALAPGSANDAPPGWYMLVIVNRRGVPSAAEFVSVGR
jgi:hypothetical protein